MTSHRSSREQLLHAIARLPVRDTREGDDTAAWMATCRGDVEPVQRRGCGSMTLKQTRSNRPASPGRMNIMMPASRNRAGRTILPRQHCAVRHLQLTQGCWMNTGRVSRWPSNEAVLKTQGSGRNNRSLMQTSADTGVAGFRTASTPARRPIQFEPHRLSGLWLCLPRQICHLPPEHGRQT